MSVVRKNYLKLGADERKALVDALLKLKVQGNPGTGRTYDTYVDWHRQMMNMPMQLMRAHMSPMFLPWHRQFVLFLEQDLQGITGNHELAVPYWDWSDASAGKNESLWETDFMGGDGRPGDGKVMTGPFAFDKGNWPIKFEDNPFLTRFMASVQLPSGIITLPPAADVASLMTLDTYDLSPWDMDADIRKSFRNNLEGWGAAEPRLHNRVHVWVGGDNGTMAQGTSPNDPVFFLHHANIDRLWGQWQDAAAGHQYLPVEDVPEKPGVSLDSPMPIFPEVTPRHVLDYRSLGYVYDTSMPVVAAPRELRLAPVPGPVFKPFRGLVGLVKKTAQARKMPSRKPEKAKTRKR